MALDAEMIRLIDQRIRAERQAVRAVGTCVDRATTGPGANVIFDGSTVAMPVKVPGNVFLQPGNRCLLDKYGSDWVVTESWSGFGLGEASANRFGTTTTGPVSSASFVDYTDFEVIRFDKAYDNTYVRIGLQASCFSSTAGAGVRFGVRLTAVESGTGYTSTDYPLTWIYCGQTNVHVPNYFAYRPTGIPAGSYNVQMRWRRANGATGCQTDSNDQISLEMDEGVRSNTPIL